MSCADMVDGPGLAATPGFDASAGGYEAALARAGAHRAVVLQTRADELARHVRRAGGRNPDTAVPGQAAAAWLRANLRQDDADLRRGAVAALALGLERRAAGLPQALRTAFEEAHPRLERSVKARRPYSFDSFTKDVALASGLAIPAGAFNLYAPPPVHPDNAALRTRRAAMSTLRYARQFGAGEAKGFAASAGLRPWAELHLDLRAHGGFDAPGMDRTYRLAAALIASRPDLAGLFGASWLYDPRLAVISPELSFQRRSAEDGGAWIVRLRPDAVQSDFAVARSPLRRRLVEEGRFKPVCYAMYWLSEELIGWSGRTQPVEATRLQVVRK